MPAPGITATAGPSPHFVLICKALLNLGLFALLLGCSGCVRASDESTLEKILRTGVARVGYANEAPYAYMDSDQRRLTGEAPEIARIILKRMGVQRVEGVLLTEFGTLIPGLKARRFDLIAAGMYITPPRARQVAFSNPTYAIGEALIVARDNPLQLHSYTDVVENPEARLGVAAGAIQRRYAKELGVPDSRLVVFPDAPSALAGVGAGRVDAYAATSLTAGDLLRRTSSVAVELAEPFENPVINGKPAVGYGAFAFHKDDHDLVATFNHHLAEFIGTPEHLELIESFGFSEATLPGDVTAAELSREVSP